jgi:hypothetical protein
VPTNLRFFCHRNYPDRLAVQSRGNVSPATLMGPVSGVLWHEPITLASDRNDRFIELVSGIEGLSMVAVTHPGALPPVGHVAGTRLAREAAIAI